MELARILLRRPPGRDEALLGYALTFLIVALIAGLLGFTGIAGASGHIAWLALVALFVLTLAAAVARALNGITNR